MPTSARCPRTAAAAARGRRRPGRQRHHQGDRVTTGSIAALGENLSAPGGSVTLSAQSALIVGGAVDTSGAAGSSGNPARRAAAGAMSWPPRTARSRSAGGCAPKAEPAARRGSARRATAATAARSRSSCSPSRPPPASSAAAATAATPASRTAPRGRGGDGGRVRVWAQLPSLILLQLVDSTGGTGDAERHRRPADGGGRAHGPLDLEDAHALVHDARARCRGLPRVPEHRRRARQADPDDEGQRASPLPKVAACVSGRLHASPASTTGVGWQSDPIGPVSFMAPPSDHAGLHRRPAGHARACRS